MVREVARALQDAHAQVMAGETGANRLQDARIFTASALTTPDLDPIERKTLQEILVLIVQASRETESDARRTHIAEARGWADALLASKEELACS